MAVEIIILAAGSSSRMGQSKQLLPISGTPMLRKVVLTSMATVADTTLVVLGKNHEAHRRVIDDLDVSIFINEKWEQGIGNSLKAGLTSLLSAKQECSAVLIVLADQPAITTHQLNKLIESFKQSSSPIVASVYAGAPGVPALFDRSLFDDLLNIRDDAGAKVVIQKNLERTTLIDLPDGAIDLDTPEDYRAFPGSRPL